MDQKANITQQQYQKVLEYLDEARSRYMHLLYLTCGGSVLLALPGLSLLRGVSGSLYVTAAGMLWYVCLVGAAILLVIGYQKKFGSNAPVAQFKQRNFSCEYITVGQLSGSEGRPPYLVTDTLGKQYICPVYLEFKQLQRGGSAIGIYLPDGSCYAVHDTSTDTY